MERNGLAAAVAGTIAAYPPELRRKISAVMAEVIAAETHNHGIEIDEADGARLSPEQLHSEILRLNTSVKPQKIAFLRITDAALEIIVPLVSMALVAWDGDVKAVVAGPQSVSMLWKDLTTLEGDTDGVPIDVYEALVAVSAAKRTAKEGAPTTQEIAGRVPTRSVLEVGTGLKRLVDLKLIEVASWGGSDGDLSHGGNAWRVRL